MFAEQGVGRGRRPVLQRWFFEILDVVQARGGPVAACHHLARDLGVPPLVRVDQLAVFEIGEPDEAEDDQQNDLQAPGHATGVIGIQLNSSAAATLRSSAARKSVSYTHLTLPTNREV